VVGLICLHFGLGIVGLDNILAVIGDALLSPVKSESDGLSLMTMMPLLVGAGLPVHLLLSFVLEAAPYPLAHGFACNV
jgi:hypothetical protein